MLVGAFILGACGGGGGGGGSGPAHTSTTVTVTGTVDTSLSAKPFITEKGRGSSEYFVGVAQYLYPPKTTVTGGALNFANTPVNVYDINNQLVGTAITDGIGRYSIDLPPNGTYIFVVTSGNVVMKSIEVVNPIYPVVNINPRSTAIALTLLQMLSTSPVPLAKTNVSATSTRIWADQNFNAAELCVQNAVIAGNDPAADPGCMAAINLIANTSLGLYLNTNISTSTETKTSTSTNTVTGTATGVTTGTYTSTAIPTSTITSTGTATDTVATYDVVWISVVVTQTSTGTGTGAGASITMQPLNLSGIVQTAKVYAYSTHNAPTKSPFLFVSSGCVTAAGDGNIWATQPRENIVVNIEPVNDVATIFAGAGTIFNNSDVLYLGSIPAAYASIPNQYDYAIGNNGSSDGIPGYFYNPGGIIIDPFNRYLYVADGGNHEIRQINVSTGSVSTIAGSTQLPNTLMGPAGITIDPHGDFLYVTDIRPPSDCYIRRIEIATGLITGVAGGSCGFGDGNGFGASFDTPQGITTDGANLYVADYGNGLIRKVVLATGDVTTLAGSYFSSGFSDGIGSNAQFWNPMGVLTDGKYVYVADTGNNAIRKVEISSGNVTTVAGGSKGFVDGTGNQAQFNNPACLTFLYHPLTGVPIGLVVLDAGNGSIRYIF